VKLVLRPPAPAAAPAVAAPVASSKKAGEPFGGKQAPPFGKKNDSTSEDKDDKKEASVPAGFQAVAEATSPEIANTMASKGYTSHAAKWLLKRKGASYINKKFGSNSGGSWISNEETSKVEEGTKVPEVSQAHGLRDDNTGITLPATTLPGKLAALSTSKALKDAQAAQEKLKALYLDCKALTEANNTRPVREAVELVYAAFSAFDEAVKVFNKQQMQEEEEEKATEIEAKKKKSSWGGLSVAAGE
jgi:hypothetical protein